MYNLHSHSLLSDGCLLPAEIAVRYEAAGFKTIAITDHADYSNIKQLIKAILDFCRTWPQKGRIKVLPGIELTHLPPEQFKPLTNYARSKGIKIIVGHGQTPVEPVVSGTNAAAISAGIDILAHPGVISDEDTLLAKEKGVFLEVTTRLGHNQTNTHVINQALKHGARLVLNTDSHHPDDIITPEEIINRALEAGLSKERIADIYKDVGEFLK
jgi:histidinol phosphatase-like PHP family hydrolase